MASLHANSARETLVKMCTLPLLAGENISARVVVPTVATSVDLVEGDAIETEPVFTRRGEPEVQVQGFEPVSDLLPATSSCGDRGAATTAEVRAGRLRRKPSYPQPG